MSASEESPKERVLQRNHQKKECFRGVTKRRNASEESPKEGRKRKTSELKEATCMSLSVIHKKFLGKRSRWDPFLVKV